MDPLTIVMLAILAMLIFFLVRNSRKRKEELSKLQEKMVPGAEVMTNFGLFGTLLSIDEENNVAVIETSPGSTVKVHRQTLARVVDETEDETDDADDAERDESVEARALSSDDAPSTVDADPTPDAPSAPTND